MTKEINLGALYRIIGAVDSLSDMLNSLGPDLQADDRVPALFHLRTLYLAAIDALDEERAGLLHDIIRGDHLLDPEQFKKLTSHTTRARLSVLRGYLHGCVAEMQVTEQMRQNAEAYAAAKVREERGVGFRAGSPPST